MSEPTLHAIAPIFQIANLQRAIDYCTRVIAPLAGRNYGMRDGRIHDPDGNAINLGESLVKD